MRLCRLLLLAGLLSTSFSTAWAEKDSEARPLPSEKVQIIYENLLAPEGDAFRQPETLDEGLSQEVRSASVPETIDEKMTAQRVAGILKGQNITLQGKPGQWQFVHEEMQVFLLVDSESNRLRLVTPLARLGLLRQDPGFVEVDLLRKLLTANYLSTGDVRLCLNRHIVWAAFLHPLDTLTERDLLGALAQLVRVARETRRDGS